MPFRRAGQGHFEAHYATPADFLPEVQVGLEKALDDELPSRRLSVVFLVDQAVVPRAVPEFWLKVTARLAPRLCGIAVVSAHLSVRSAASAFSVVNRLRNVKLSVKSFKPDELEAARQWCSELRAAPAR